MTPSQPRRGVLEVMFPGQTERRRRIFAVALGSALVLSSAVTVFGLWWVSSLLD